MDKFEALKKYFGYSSFRDGQEKIIDNILNGVDCLGVMPTGGGKSICFQIPALLSEGVTFVISPLISLMKDQVNSLVQNGIRAAYINGSLTEGQIKTVYKRIKNGAYKIIYVAPERLSSFEFLDLCGQIDISIICIDEAHCVSQWGHDFRPSYLKISDFIKSLNVRPVVCAFTATAAQKVRYYIIKLIGLNEPFVEILSFDRKNLYFETVKSNNKYLDLRKYLDLYKGRSGIVYCSSRKKVDELYSSLESEGYSVAKYHAGLEKNIRKINQDLFISDRKSIIIATNAFGMGIDKSNVSFVIHYNMPGDIESYYQEAGRAGRDGNPADCILLFSYEDVKIQQFFINNPEENEEQSEKEKLRLRALRQKKLQSMIDYSLSTRCLRNFILGYFGEATKGKCNNCSCCNKSTQSIDITVDSRKILSCIARVKQNENADTVADILKGTATAYIIQNGFDKLSTFGIMKAHSTDTIKDLIDFLEKSEYIKTDSDCLKLCESAWDILKGGKQLRRPISKIESFEPEQKTESKIDIELYERLIKLRNEIAHKMSLPSFIIFTDASISAMATIKPKNSTEMLNVPGVSEKKKQKYAALFLAEINKDTENNERGVKR